MASKGRKVGAAPPRADVRITIGDGRDKGKPTRAERARAELVDTLQGLKDSLRPESGHVIRLWRYSPAIHDDEYLGPMPLVEFSLDTVAKAYGGGQFGWRVTDADGKYLKVGDGGVQRFNIAGPPHHPDGASIPTPGESPSYARDMFALMKDLVLERRAAVGAGPDLGALALQMATAMASVQAATMAAMKELSGNAPRAAGSPGDMLDTITAVLDLTERIKGDGSAGGSDPLATAAFTAVARALERVAETQRASGQRPTARLTDAPRTPAPAQPTPAPEGETAMTSDPRSVLAPFVGQLVKLAERNRNPAAYVDPMLDQLADFPDVMGHLERCTTPESRAELEGQLGLAFPEMKPHAAWFADFWREVWEALDEPPAADVAITERTPRAPDAGDPPGSE